MNTNRCRTIILWSNIISTSSFLYKCSLLSLTFIVALPGGTVSKTCLYCATVTLKNSYSSVSCHFTRWHCGKGVTPRQCRWVRVIILICSCTNIRYFFHSLRDSKQCGLLTLQRGVTSTARHSVNITCRGVTSPARHAARSHSFVYISTS